MSVSAPNSLRERHRAQIVEFFRAAGTASRAEVGRSTGLSRTTVSTLVAEMQEDGTLVGQPSAPPGTGAGSGRPAHRLMLNPARGNAIGVDFGHTHLRVAVADLAATILAERTVELDVDRAARAAVEMAGKLVAEVIEEAAIDRDRVVAVGLGMPGPIDFDSGIIGSSGILAGWEGLRPAELMEAALGVPVWVDNDANLGALGELTFGAAQGSRQLVYVKVSSGIGAGLVLDGRLYRGATGIAGEFGHVLVDPDGAICRCGNRGCLETVAATGPLRELLRPTYGDDFGVADLVAQAAAGDAGCRRVLADAGRAIGLQLAGVCNVFNPDRIVIGGELSVAGDSLLDGIRDSLSRHAQPGAYAAAGLVAGVLGDRAEVLGAVALVTSGLASGATRARGRQPTFT